MNSGVWSKGKRVGGGGLERFRARDAFDPPFRHEGVKLNHLPQDELPVTTISVE